MSEEELGYIKIKSEPMGNKTSLQIITILFSIIAALIFIVKIMYFEKKKAKTDNKNKNTKNKPLVEEPLKKMIMYLMGVILFTVGLYSSNVFVQRIFFACALIVIIGLCIYINNNRDAVLNAMGGVGSGFKNILKYLSKLTFGLFGVLYAIISTPEKIPGIGPWLASKTESSDNISSKMSSFLIMGCKIFVKLVLFILLLPFVITGAAFYVVWLILVAIIYPFNLLKNFIFNFLKKKSSGTKNDDGDETVNPLVKIKPEDELNKPAQTSMKIKPTPKKNVDSTNNNAEIHDLYPQTATNSG